MGNQSSKHGGHSGQASASGSGTPAQAQASSSISGRQHSGSVASSSRDAASGVAGSSSAGQGTLSPSSRADKDKDKDVGNKAKAAALYAQDARVDNGHLLPLSNIYPNAPQDWLHDVVQRLIVERRLAPFYRGLEDWDEDSFDKQAIDDALDLVGDDQAKRWRREKYSSQDRMAEAAMYKKTSECPICFLYYPPLINSSRCCDQPICTECFVQIKRADPTTTNLISEPAACPFCVEPHFGVTYVPPPLNRRTGLGAPSTPATLSNDSRFKSNVMGEAPPLERSSSSQSSELDMGPAAKAHARRKSVSHTSADVVTVDAIQDDWEARLAAVKATAARRAARRVVFRQVGERLIPVGISSGREINLNNSIVDDQGRLILTGPIPIVGQGGTSSSVEAGGSHGHAGSRLLGRSRRLRGNSAGNDSSMDPRLMGMGPDLEELMVMEAMRLSMVDEEERRKKAEKEAKEQAKKDKKDKKRKSVLGESSSSRNASPRASNDGARVSSDTSTNPTSSAPVAGPSSARTPASPTTSRLGGSTTSTFLKMPPMLRNDSSASMARHNLPPPLMPDRVGSPVTAGAQQPTAPAPQMDDLI